MSGGRAVTAGPSSTAVQRFERDGFVTVGSVLDQDVCSQLRTTFEDQARRRRAGTRSTLSADRFERVAADGTLVLTVLLDHAGLRRQGQRAVAPSPVEGR